MFMRALSLRAYSEVIRKCNTLSTEQVTYSKHTESYINLIKSTSNIYMGLDGADCNFYCVKMKIYFRLVVCVEMPQLHMQALAKTHYVCKLVRWIKVTLTFY